MTIEMDSQRTLFYVLDDGKRYVDSALYTAEGKLLNKRRFLKLRNTT